MSRLIINASNLRGGGALQVASTFIEGLKSFSQNYYFVFLPPALSESIEEYKFTKNFIFYHYWRVKLSLIAFFRYLGQHTGSLKVIM
jgi:hypothetical protein